jgi:lipocalin-like protein
MLRSLFSSLLLLSMITTAFAQGLTGTYRVASLTAEVDGASPNAIFGNSPRGFALFTSTRVTFLITAEGRKFGKSAEERAALWDTLAAYSGTYRLDGSKFVVSVDVSANEIWNGTQQVRNWQLDGKRLTITTERAPYSRDPSKMVVIRLVADRVE